MIYCFARGVVPAKVFTSDSANAITSFLMSDVVTLLVTQQMERYVDPTRLRKADTRATAVCHLKSAPKREEIGLKSKKERSTSGASGRT
jgi:hypothetical protein